MMSGKIFISYRRDDSAAIALGIGQYLAKEFGRRNVFIDVDINAGAKFPVVLERRLTECKVLLAVIGPNWLDVRNDAGKRRLDDPNDWVRLEIARALKRDITVIPVLIGGAELPKKADLSEDIQGLLDHQSAAVTTIGFRNEMGGLARDIRAIPNAWAWRRVAVGATAVLAVMVAGWIGLRAMGVPVWVPWEMARRSAANDAAEVPFRRAYYEHFDYDPQGLPTATAEVWPPGRHADWETTIANGVLTVCNVSDAPGASFTNRLAYSESAGQPIDQADAKVTVHVRLAKNPGTMRGAGIMFRKSPAEGAYYAFLATPGDAVTLYFNSGKALRALWSGDSIPPGRDGFYTLKVEGRGRTLDLYANDRLVHTEGGTTLLHGDPGVMAFGLGCFEFADIAVFLPVVSSTD
jgi:hypothetical protein